MLGKLIKHELRAMLNKFSLVAVIFLVVSVILWIAGKITAVVKKI